MKSKMNFKHSLVVVLVLLMTSCANYQITTSSLLEQLEQAKPVANTSYLAPFPVVLSETVNGHSLKEVTVLDKRGHECTIPVTKETGLRITKKDGSSELFYFDTLLISDSIMTGKNNRFFSAFIHPINLNLIDKIEVQ